MVNFFHPIQESVETVEIVGWPDLIAYYAIKQPFFVTLPETSGDFAKCRLFYHASFILVHLELLLRERDFLFSFFVYGIFNINGSLVFSSCVNERLEKVFWISKGYPSVAYFHIL